MVAYSYSISTKETDQPDGGSPYKFNVTAYAVSGGGGGGYGGGGSGAAAAIGAQTINVLGDGKTVSDAYSVSAGVVAGGGGGGGSFVAADVINPTFQRSSGQGTVRGESRDGIGQYAFCVSK